MTTPVEEALDTFVTHYQQTNSTLWEPYDAEWRSQCEIGSPHRGEDGVERIQWQPLRRRVPPADFAGLEAALELTIHQDIKDYYGRYWSAGLEAEAPDGHVSLILLWNDADVERLTENVVGHSLACKQARRPLSVFFACTEPESELFLAVDNNTGAVLLERPGYKPVRTVAAGLAEFIDILVPAAPPTEPHATV